MANLCIIENCDKPQRGRGWCMMHYTRWKKHGDPNLVERVQRSTNEASAIEIFEDYATVALSSGKFAIIDLADVDKVKKYNWYWSNTTGYAYSFKAGTSLQQFLIGKAPNGFVIDHDNKDKLDCRRSNLDFVTHAHNSRNRNGIRGIAWHNASGKWQAYANLQREFLYLGVYKTEEQALAARELGNNIALTVSSVADFKIAWKKMKPKI